MCKLEADCVSKCCCFWLGPFEVEKKSKYEPTDLSALRRLICHELLSYAVVINTPCPLKREVWSSTKPSRRRFTSATLPNICTRRSQFPAMITHYLCQPSLEKHHIKQSKNSVSFPQEFSVLYRNLRPVFNTPSL